MLDLQLPGLSGLDLQKELVKAGIRIPIIFVTGHGDIPTSVRAMKAAALQFLTKPINYEDLLDAIQQAIARDQRARLGQGETGGPNFGEIVGRSAAITEVLKQVEVVAPTESTVLILGETDTGKELIARAIHSISSRSNRPFVKLNCAAIPSALLESELFGHEKGAFTGAVAQRIGRFELADGGTLFLARGKRAYFDPMRGQCTNEFPLLAKRNGLQGMEDAENFQPWEFVLRVGSGEIKIGSFRLHCRDDRRYWNFQKKWDSIR